MPLRGSDCGGEHKLRITSPTTQEALLEFEHGAQKYRRMFYGLIWIETLVHSWAY